jgi:hypothetical protein
MDIFKIQNANCWSRCGGFGFIKMEPEEDMNDSLIIGKGKGAQNEGGGLGRKG